jgi:hypothetical protein
MLEIIKEIFVGLALLGMLWAPLSLFNDFFNHKS